MTIVADEVFDFSRTFTTEDVVERVIDGVDEARYVDVLHTAAGHRALWNWSTSFDSCEEAIAWLKTVNAE